MRTIVFSFFSMLLAIIPMSGMAQSNIQSAFKSIINCPQAQITENHTLDKDPDTKVKTGQCDVYSFVLPADKIGLIKKVIAAFEKDSPLSFGINRGKAKVSDSQILLAVGDATGNNIYVNEPGCEYMYMLFLAPESEDADGKYRYAYAMNYKEDDGNLIGKLIVTYATTLKYRQSVENNKQPKVFTNISNQRVVTSPNGTVVVTSSDLSKKSWFDVLMTYLQGIASTSANNNTRIALATEAYKHINKYPNVVDDDKITVREVIKVLLNDPNCSDPMLNTLLKRCLVALK